MILRVYAMWNRSKLILYSLLFISVPQIIVSFIFTGIYDSPNTFLSGMSPAKLQANLESHAGGPLLFPPVSIVQVVDFSFCNGLTTSQTARLAHFYATVPRFVLGVTLLILVGIPTLRESVGMYRATKQWWSNRYLQQLMRDGIFYFLVYAPLSTLFHCYSLGSHAPV